MVVGSSAASSATARPFGSIPARHILPFQKGACRQSGTLETPTDEWPIVRNPRVMGGPPCFRGTRTPVTVLFDDLTAGVPLEEILLNHPTLARQDALAVLRAAGRMVADRAA
jgi:uncharacterized protein (DUF433 family)